MNQHTKKCPYTVPHGTVGRIVVVSGVEVPVPGGYALNTRIYRPGRQLL